MVMAVAGSTTFDESTTTGTTETRKLVWTSGWARNEVRTLSSSCEWWTAWNRHTGVHRWLAQWASQLHPSIRMSADARRTSCGTTARCGATNHGATRLRAPAKPPA